MPLRRFDLTVRWGHPRTRYHQVQVEVEVAEGGGLKEALEAAAGLLPDEVAATADLAEVRPAPDPEGRNYLGDGGQR